MKISVLGHIDGVVELVGSIETLPAYEEQFSYDEGFIARHPKARLSLSLPAQPEPFVSRQTRPYFKNLLPEGAALRAIAKRFEVNEAAYLQILSRLGDECIGAVVIRGGDGSGGDAVEGPGYRVISRSELEAFARREADGMADLQAGSKLSLAGAQSKMGVRVQGEGASVEYLLPRGEAASTHIMKTANRRFEMLSENEHCCMRLASACGIEVPKTFVDVLDGGVPIFLVERYDREVAESGEVVRLHQEDFCQVLGLLPEKKYEVQGRNYAKLCGDLIARNSALPVEDLKSFVAVMVFNVLIGNCDGHLKNMSFVCDGGWARRRLAPAYDLASTVVYGGLDRHFAMRIGSSNRIEEIRRDDFALMADEIGMKRAAVEAIVDEVSEGVLLNIGEVVGEIEDTLGQKVDKLREIREFAERKAGDLR